MRERPLGGQTLEALSTQASRIYAACCSLRWFSFAHVFLTLASRLASFCSSRSILVVVMWAPVSARRAGSKPSSLNKRTVRRAGRRCLLRADPELGHLFIRGSVGGGLVRS